MKKRTVQKRTTHSRTHKSNERPEGPERTQAKEMTSGAVEGRSAVPGMFGRFGKKPEGGTGTKPYRPSGAMC